MTPFGTYRLVYEPPANTLEGSMEMSISSEATLDQMLDLYAAFLRASGYAIDFGAELSFIQEEQRESFDPMIEDWSPSQDFWKEDGISLTGNPYASGDYYISSPVTPGVTSPTYISSGVLGGMGNDIVSFG